MKRILPLHAEGLALWVHGYNSAELQSAKRFQTSQLDNGPAWFGTRGSEVQILSPRPSFLSLFQLFTLPFVLQCFRRFSVHSVQLGQLEAKPHCFAHFRLNDRVHLHKLSRIRIAFARANLGNRHRKLPRSRLLDRKKVAGRGFERTEQNLLNVLKEPALVT